MCVATEKRLSPRPRILGQGRDKKLLQRPVLDPGGPNSMGVFPWTMTTILDDQVPNLLGQLRKFQRTQRSSGMLPER